MEPLQAAARSAHRPVREWHSAPAEEREVARHAPMAAAVVAAAAAVYPRLRQAAARHVLPVAANLRVPPKAQVKAAA